MEHDPLCRAKHMDVATEWDDLGGCDCPVIARVKADEQKRIGDAGRLPIARPVCTCGHLKANHHPDGRGKCSVWAHMRDSGPCGCRKYEEDTSAPAAHPA